MDFPNKAPELEWYQLETKMRELLYEQMVPIVNQSKKDREMTLLLKKRVEKQAQKIKHLEQSVYHKKSRETVLEELHNRIIEQEGNRKKDLIRLDQELTNFKENVKSAEFSVKTSIESVKRLEDLSLRQGDEIQQLRDMLNEHKQVVIEQVKMLDDNFKQQNDIYLQFVQTTEQKSTSALNKGNSNQQDIHNLRNLVEDARRDLFQGLTEIQSFNQTKLNISQFNQVHQELQEQAGKLEDQCGEIRDEILKRDIFIDKYFPFKICRIVSDALYSCLPQKLRFKLATHEHKMLKNVNYEILLNGNLASTRESATQDILDDIKVVEVRKSNIIAEAQYEENEDKYSKKKKLQDFFIEMENQAPKIDSEQLEKDIYKIAGNIWQVENMKIGIQIGEATDALKQQMKRDIQEQQIFSQNLANDLQKTQNQIQLLLGNSSLDLVKNKKQIEEVQNDISSIGETVSGLAQMVACIVENAQIDQALASQEEEEKHQRLQNQQGLTIKAKGLTPEPEYSQNLLKSIKKRQNTPKLSNLLYRNKIYTRAQLLQLKGRMVKNCWEAISTQLPWKQHEFDQVIQEATKRPKRSRTAKPQKVSTPSIMREGDSRPPSHNHRRLIQNFEL